MDELTALLDDLHRDPTDADWRAKWLRTCELSWRLMSDQTPMSKNCTDRFLELLLDSDRFSIARLVVAEFRAAHPTGLNEAQQHIVDASQEIRLRVRAGETTTQDDFDDAAFVQEKRILQDAEMHRARVLFHHSGKYGSIDPEKMQQWSDAFPGSARR